MTKECMKFKYQGVQLNSIANSAKEKIRTEYSECLVEYVTVTMMGLTSSIE
jgi:hypothetical protein